VRARAKAAEREGRMKEALDWNAELVRLQRAMQAASGG